MLSCEIIVDYKQIHILVVYSTDKAQINGCRLQAPWV